MCWLLIFSLLGWSSATSTTPSQELSDYFEQAVYAEETLGDLRAAIEAYGRVVNDTQVDRGLRAKALLRMSQCYIKQQEQAAAVVLLNQMVREYPEQTDLVAQAKALLPQGIDRAYRPICWPDLVFQGVASELAHTDIRREGQAYYYSDARNKVRLKPPRDWFYFHADAASPKTLILPPHLHTSGTYQKGPAPVEPLIEEIEEGGMKMIRYTRGDNKNLGLVFQFKTEARHFESFRADFDDIATSGEALTER